MENLGLSNFSFRIEQSPDGFRYLVSFSLPYKGGMCGTAGVMPTWEQCIDVMRDYVAQTVREAVGG